MDSIYYTGYFGRGKSDQPLFGAMLSRPFPDVPLRWTKVHIVKDGTPICNSNIGNDMVFRNMTSGICLKWVECAHCRKLTKKLEKLEDYLIDENAK